MASRTLRNYHYDVMTVGYDAHPNFDDGDYDWMMMKVVALCLVEVMQCDWIGARHLVVNVDVLVLGTWLLLLLQPNTPDDRDSSCLCLYVEAE